MTLWWLRRPAGTPLATEQALLSQARTGDRAALQLLLTPHEPVLFRVCLALLGDRSEAEDAAQETLVQAVRALQKPAGFRGEARLQTWLIRIAYRSCYQRLRKQRASRDLAVAEPQETTPGPEAATIQRVVLQEALRHLTETQRTCLVLQAVEGWSMAEIGTVLGINTKKVENELYRARKALARWQEENEENHD